jgi:hypothetical protein
MESELSEKNRRKVMTQINPINVNTQGIGSSYGYGAKPKAEQKEAEEAKAGAAGSPKPQLSADDVLSYLAQSAAVTAPKTVDPAKYVDKASEERIAGFMAGFEDKVAEGLAAFAKEFPSASEKTAETVVLANINKEA